MPAEQEQEDDAASMLAAMREMQQREMAPPPPSADSDGDGEDEADDDDGGRDGAAEQTAEKHRSVIDDILNGSTFSGDALTNDPSDGFESVSEDSSSSSDEDNSYMDFPPQYRAKAKAAREARLVAKKQAKKAKHAKPDALLRPPVERAHRAAGGFALGECEVGASPYSRQTQALEYTRSTPNAVTVSLGGASSDRCTLLVGRVRASGSVYVRAQEYTRRVRARGCVCVCVHLGACMRLTVAGACLRKIQT